ncbi:MAG: DUF4911 domain-containing protein [Deltaproteobacteria bacterium]|nr:DUF4911 domain-containing protein [Deltaproteobacteria bacterium]
MQTTICHYRVERREIAYLRFILEGYDGAAVLTTLDSAGGVVRLCVAPGNLSLIRDLMDHLGREMPLEALPPDDVEARGSDV